MLVYWIKSGSKNYIGATTDFRRRLRQHNGELRGGARCTQGRVWTQYRAVTGFTDWRDCLKFEWHLKRILKRNKYDDRAFDDFVEMKKRVDHRESNR